MKIPALSCADKSRDSLIYLTTLRYSGGAALFTASSSSVGALFCKRTIKLIRHTTALSRDHPLYPGDEKTVPLCLLRLSANALSIPQ